MAAVGDGSSWGLEITYLHQAAPLGLAHCVLIARDFLGDDDFVMYLGDNLIRQGVKPFVDRFEAERRASAAPTLGRHPRRPGRPDPAGPGARSRSASAWPSCDETGQVVRLVEKPEVPASDLALVGVYLFDKTIHEAVRAIQPSRPGRARDHRRHPVADRPAATWFAATCSRAGSSTPAS